MLKRLTNYQKEIAINFITLFLVGGLIPMVTSASPSYINYYRDVDPHKKSYSYVNRNASERQAEMDETLSASGAPAPIKPAKKEKDLLVNMQKSLLNSGANQPEIGGPGQPEMAAFKSAGADNMVNLFTGDMSYNIPLLDVGGYPVNIFYNSGITVDQEASWVGLGWNINPGTIMRNMRGVPDDFDGTDSITKTLSMRPDKTWGVGVGGGLEVAGTPLGLSGNLGISVNNMRGLGMEFGANAHLNLSKTAADEKTAPLTLGASLGINLNSQSGATVTPAIDLNLKGKSTTTGRFSASVGYNSRVGLQSLHLDAEVSKTKSTGKNCSGYEDFKSKDMTGYTSASASVMSSNISFAYPSVTPSIRARLSRLSMTASIKLGYAAWFCHPNGTLNGYYSISRIADEDKVTKHPAYGLMYFQKANDDPNALLDFNRLQDGVFTKTNPTIAIPAYSYDVFSISGEGVGGTFRAYRGDLGYVHDATVTTREDAGKVGFDIGLGPLAGHGGANLEYVYSPTTAGPWSINNLAKNTLQFRESAGAYRSVYFKNPGEKTIPDINFQNAVGGEDLVRLKMDGYQTGAPALLPMLEKFNASKVYTGTIPLSSSAVIRNRRDKRTQVISCLNAEEASRAGFDKSIKSYNSSSTGVIFGGCDDSSGITKIKRNTGIAGYTGTDNYRKGHHISEVDVLGADGRRYIYGIPVYNTKQVDATFNINNGNTGNLQSSYSPGVDDSKNNSINKDWYVEKEEIPAYTHSFLLTELVSPNYVDVTNNGLTEDDMGDAIKFNYSEFAPVKWRTPVGNNKATYNEGLKTNNQDDKAHYTYGEREQWYLYSIESKNMVARFYVANDRHDGKQVQNMAGAIDTTYGAQRLTHIDLFSKGDLIKYGSNARPIKSVYFEYDYTLCPYVPTNDGHSETVNGVNINYNHGKLTLKSIWFTYNGNQKQKKNKYSFYYPSAKNYTYDFTANDRWGNFKPFLDTSVYNNPGNLPNSDYPYSLQNKTRANAYAAAWVMDSIGLPAGGKIKIDYESDDYAYVQDRRAAAMYRIMGFGATNNPDTSHYTNTHLYDGPAEYNYIYAKVPIGINTIQSTAAQIRELRSKYFNSKSNQLFMKLAVDMPADNYGSGYELIPMYADIVEFGVIPITGSGTSDKIFIKVKSLETHTPMVQYALQFLKNNLPGKAFPAYDNMDGGLAGVVRALGGMFNAVKELFRGVDNNLKANNRCKIVETEKSFLRLTDPYFAKLGGGLRVKKITMSDNWDKMTGQPKAVYGREYKYTTTENINGDTVTVSSGVASWEPTIGGEENPHREMMSYYNHNKGGPFDYNSVELPLAEMFFPSPDVGYSHVEVLPMHRDTVKNPVGRTVTEYFTTKEFPTKSDYTLLEDRTGGGASFHEDATALAVLRIRAEKHYALSQGFKVDLNDMNGKLKMEETIGANNMPITQTINFYNTKKITDDTYNFNHNFSTLNDAGGTVSNSVIGRDIEIMTDFRNHNAKTISTNMDLNIDGQMIGIFPVIIPPMMNPVFKEENDYRSAALLKIVTHYGMLDSVVSIDKGSQVNTKNLVYDAETGNVLLTRTNNEHNKPVYNFTYPAHWAYSGMGPAYKNIDVEYHHLLFRNGSIETGTGDSVGFSNFESGDELYVYSALATGPFVGSCDVGVCSLPKNTANRVWAINTNKTGNGDHWVFMDATGQPYQATDVTMRIIRSGHRNMLEQMIGSVTSMNNPIRSNHLVFDDTTAILNTTAATFKDNWRVDDYLYRKDSLVKIIDTVKQVYLVDTPAIVTITKDENQYSFSFNDHPIISSLKKYESTDGDTVLYKTRKTWLKYEALKNYILQYKDINPDGYLWTYIALSTHGDPYDSLDAGCRSVRGTHNGIHTVPSPPSIYNGFADSTYYGDVSYGNHNHYGNASITQLMRTPWYDQNDTAHWKYAFGETNSLSPLSKITLPFIDSLTYNIGQEILLDTITKNLFSKAKRNEDFITGFSIQTYFPSTVIGEENLSCWWGNTDSACSTSTSPILVSTCIPCYGKIDSIRYFYTGPYAHYYVGFCNNNDTFSICKSRFSDSLINPYVQGIFGNWRADSIYTYYGQRKESDPTTNVDTRTAGTIIGYESFWNFHTPFLQRNYSASDVWVWNSTSTQFNRKGYETENKDPLGRFNAGLYGYNQQLPVAVANNSRLREMMYDGFEDYDYKSAQSCNSGISDCTPMRHANFTDIEHAIDSTEHHTGRFSLRVKPDSAVTLSATVVPADSTNASYSFSVNTATQSCTDTTVTPHGQGFRTQFHTRGHGYYVPVQQYLNVSGYAPHGGITINWDGVLIAPADGVYTFYTFTYNVMDVVIHHVVGLTSTLVMTHHTGYGWAQHDVVLEKGQTYYIEAYMQRPHHGDYMGLMKWITPEMRCAGITEPVVVAIPYIYTPVAQDGTRNADIHISSATRYKLSESKTIGNAFTDHFSPLQGKKMVLSAWVKESRECKCSTYVHNQISIAFGGGSPQVFHPSGNITEGWQRYESVFSIPDDATLMSVELSSSEDSVYFDDIRIHPFNANEKSFVYHSSNLRLMAELDENNYASFYEYDDDGTLIRVKKETERGIKTITETRSALQKVE